MAAQPVDPARLAAEAARQVQEREQALRQQVQPAPDVRLFPSDSPPESRHLPKAESPCFVIERVEISGAAGTQIDPRQLEGALGEVSGEDRPEGRCLGAQGVDILARRAQAHLVARGHITSRVLVPPQDLGRGLLRLEVLVGRVGAIRLSKPDDRATLVNALSLKTGDVLNLRDVEQSLENLKRVPTVEADIQVEPGAEPGLSDLVIRWSQAMPLRLLLSVDDGGTEASGKYQSSATLSYDNPLTLNDLLYVTVSRDLGGGQPGDRGTRGINAHYSLPLGNWLLSLNGGRGRYYQSVAGATQDYVYSGTSHQQEMELRRLVHRDAAGKTTMGIKAFARQSENFIDDTEVEVQRRRVGGYELGLQHQTYWGTAQIDAGLSFRRGTGAFGSTVAPEDLFGEGTHRFALWVASVQWRQPFALGGQKWQYLGQWRGQSNRTPLTPQDRFAIGGRHTVRGFDGQSSLSAEHGWFIRNEVATGIAEGHQFFAALDHGQVGGPRAMELVGTRLTGMALGLRGGVNGLQYEVFLAKPADKPQGFRTAKTTYGVSVSAQF